MKILGPALIVAGNSKYSIDSEAVFVPINEETDLATAKNFLLSSTIDVYLLDHVPEDRLLEVDYDYIDEYITKNELLPITI